jgi:hypothetical protein
MTTASPISLACFDHDRVMPVLDGRVPVEGFTIAPEVHPTGKLFPLAVQEAHFDVTELSLSSHILQVARGDAAYTAIPCFISRAFRHNGFFRRAGSGIETPADLKGRTVGVPEYQMTAALWMRGILKDDFGVDAVDIHWRTGALDAGVRHERLALTPPPSLKITPIEDGETLQGLLLAGEIDALLAPNPPKAFIDGDPRIERIFPDFEAEEQAYHARTGFFSDHACDRSAQNARRCASGPAACLVRCLLERARHRAEATARRLARFGQPAQPSLAQRIHGAHPRHARPGLLPLWFQARRARGRGHVPLFRRTASGAAPCQRARAYPSFASRNLKGDAPKAQSND